MESATNNNISFINKMKGSTQKLAVKNKMPAPIQITAEQLLLEAVHRQADEAKAPSVRIVDEEELQNYRVQKRKEYEDTLRRQRHHMGTWISYAQWEAAQKEFRRARSIFERALEIDYRNQTIWQKYIEMETKNKFLNSARNLFDRVCQLLPRLDQFWFKYAHMEELLSNFAGARMVFDRWMEWNPDDKGWMMYIRFEERCGELDRCRTIFERFLSARPTKEAFLKFTKFQEKHRNIDVARAGFEKAIEIIQEENLDEFFYIKFAQFEERQRENERVKVIYEQALQKLLPENSKELYKKYISFQKQYGDRETLEEVVLTKRRNHYEAELIKTPNQYDLWFDYTRLEEMAGDVNKIRNLYERAISHIPPIKQKEHWKRYIYLWINYILFEELQTGDLIICRSLFEKLLKLIPHTHFSFAKIWKFYAEFELRQGNLDKTRKIYGRSLALCAKEKLFKNYSALELRFGNIDRCRKILSKFIELHPHHPKAWISLIDLEIMAEEFERARAICDIAVKMDQMDMPELVWKAFIDLEIKCEDFPAVRKLYERLLEKTQHFKVFKSYADFEFINAHSIERARLIYERGVQNCKELNLDEERAILFESWVKMEKQNGDKIKFDEIFKRLPRKVRKKRQNFDEFGEQNFEEYLAYIFPDDGPQTTNMKILEAARLWKKQKTNEISI